MAEGFAQAFRVNPVNSLFDSPAGEVSRAVYTYKSIGKKLVSLSDQALKSIVVEKGVNNRRGGMLVFPLGCQINTVDSACVCGRWYNKMALGGEGRVAETSD